MKVIEEIITSHQSVICLDGGGFSEQVSTLINDTAVLIAADGAADWMLAAGLSPHYIVGDDDSSSLESQQSLIEKIYIQDQNTTDFEKCIQFATTMKLLPTLVLGFNGGEIDHIFGNMQVLLKYSQRASLFFIDSYVKKGCIGIKIGLPLCEGNYSIKARIDATISIFPFCKCRITTLGLAWELIDQVLTQDGLLVIRNRAIKDEVGFKISKGKVLVVMDYFLD